MSENKANDPRGGLFIDGVHVDDMTDEQKIACGLIEAPPPQDEVKKTTTTRRGSTNG